MILQVKEPKSPNIAPNPLKIILNNMHYEQICMYKLNNIILSLDMDYPDVLPQFLTYKYFSMPKS